MANSSGTNSKYFQFQLGGAALNTYGSYKLYFQSQRSSSGAQAITVGYSINGTSYTNLATTVMVPASFGESIVDLSGIAALNNQTSIYIRLLASGASGAGTLRIDNFQVQAVAGTSTTPRLTPSVPTLTNFTTTDGTASASQSYTLAGANLPTDGSVRVTLPTNSGYEVSSDNTTFGQSASIAYTGTALSTSSVPSVYVRLAATTAAGTYNSVAVTNTVFDSGGTATATDATVTVSGSVQGLRVAPAALTGFSTTQGVASAVQSYVLTGVNLTASVAVAVSGSGYEISQTSATTGFGATQNITATNANATAGRTIYVRLAASAPVGAYGTTANPLRITNIGGTNLSASVAVDGVVAPPAPTITTGTLIAFNALSNTPSAAQSYALTGSNLTADVTVTAPAGFEVSQTSATTGFAGSQTVTASSGSVSATIYVRLASTATAGPVSGTIANTSAGATTSNVAVTGTVVGEPATAPTIVASAVAANTVTLTLSNNSGTNYLVVVRPFGTVAVAPTDGTAYTASATYGATGTTGPGNFVVLAGTTATVAVTGLSSSTRYAADVYAYNVGTAAGFENYLATAGTTDFTTTSGPLVTYATTGLNSNPSALPASLTAPNIVASTVTRNGVTSITTSAYVSTGFPGASSGTAPLDPTKYLAFSYGPGPGYTTTLSSVDVSLSRSNAGPQTVELRVSADGISFSNPISLGVKTVSANTTSANFASATALPSVSGTWYFRLYAYNATTSGGGNFRLEDVSGTQPAIAINGTVVVGMPVPEINLAQGTTSIASTTGSYAFATTVVGSSTAAAQFDIQNQGTAVLNLTGTPVVALSGNTADFALTQPTATTVAGGGSTPFTLTFAPTSTGTKTVTVSIANNDSDENPYTFIVTGTAVLAPVIASFAPATGPAGTQVAITGTDFTAATTVAFNGTAATAVTFNSATSLMATVPAGATTGAITVANIYGTSTSATSFVVLPTPTAGTLLVEDNFAYAAGENLVNHGWTSFSGNSGTQVTTVAGNLTQAQYPRGFDPTVAASFAGSSTVRLIGNTTSGQDVYREFTPSTGTTTSTYAAALMSVNSAEAAGSYFMTFLNSGTATQATADMRGRVFIQKSGTGFKFGISLNAAAASNYTSTVYSLNTQYLVVLKYTVTGTTNTANLYVYSGAADVVEPTMPTITTGSGNVNSSLGTLNALVLRQDDSDINVDGVRVGSGWGTAIGRPVFVDEVATLSAGNYYSVVATGTSTRVTTSGSVLLEGNLNLNGGKVTTSTTNPLTLRPGVTTQVNTSGVSFVDGPLGRQARTASSLVFPIGRSAAYRPLTLNIATAPAGDADGITTYVASQTDGPPADQALTGSLTRISRVRYYSITPTPAVSTFAGTVELAFGADDAVTDPSLASFVVAKSDGQGWSNLDRSANTNTSLTSGSFTGFSDFILASTDPNAAANPLPVTLTSFGATRQVSGAVQVAWATASEKHSAYFEVQRSLDGSTFATIANVAAQGTTTQAHTYASLDQAAPAAKLYYRLRQVDTDGKAYFSSVVTLAGTEAAATLALYPNPAHSYLKVAAAAGEEAQVIDLAGRVLQTTTLPASGQLNVEALPAGTYLLRVQLGGQPRTLRFTKE
jgi:hypothetical protein